jgi:thiamine kinase-like enzyme
MDNFLEMDVNTFIYSKSLKIFSKLNSIEFAEDEVLLEKHPLSGISNTIYKVEIKYRDPIIYSDDVNIKKFPEEIKINSVFFKIFGRISVLVDRELETYIMKKLNEFNMGPKIFETDSKTYRIEEFVDGHNVLHTFDMLKEDVLTKMISIFSTVNSLGDIDYFIKSVGNTSKNSFFEMLGNDSTTNAINFAVKKMKPLAIKSLNTFKEKYFNDDNKSSLDNNFKSKLEKIDYMVNNFEKLFYDTFPDKTIFVISHNDAHPLNILKSSDSKSVILCDFEYSCYNLLGFDIANYIIESAFYLSADSFPFYQLYMNDFNEFKDEKYYQIYLKFFNIFEEQQKTKLFAELPEFEEIYQNCKSREYYYRVMGISSLFWFIFAVLYYDYESIKNKAGYDYFNFSIERLDVYDKFVKNEI